MAQRESELPEGTDHIINGAMERDPGGSSASGSGTGLIGAATKGDDTGGTSMEDGGEVGTFRKGVESLKQQATDRARQYADDGKTRASDALTEFSRIIEQAADQVDDRLGEQFGGYARQAAGAVSGLATNLRERDVEELYDEARDFVRQSPALAIGIAAAVGFAMVRVVKAGLPDQEASEDDAAAKPSRKGKGARSKAGN